MYYFYTEYGYPEDDPIKGMLFEAASDEEALQKRVNTGFPQRNYFEYDLKEVTKPTLKQDREGTFYIDYNVIRIIEES